MIGIFLCLWPCMYLVNVFISHLLKPELLKAVVKCLEDINLIIDNLSLGEAKYMVSIL